MPAKLALQSSLPEALSPVMSQPLPSAGDREGGAEPAVDVLVSYKRADAHSFARALHTLLVLRGVGCCLDYEYRADLSDVEQVVARARNLVLVLTDNVLSSPRCLAELDAAVRNDVPVVVVVKEGARWGDASGNMLMFPSAQALRALSADVAKVFSLKPIQHRDEHYAHFAGQLVKRLKVAPPQPPPSAPAGLTMQASHISHMSAAVPTALTSAALAQAASQYPQLSPLAGLTAAAPGAAHAMEVRPMSPPVGPPPASHSPQRVTVSGAAASGADIAGISGQLQQLAAQMSMLGDLQAELAGLKAAVAAGSASTSGAVQSLSGDISGLRRELAAEVAASGRAVSGEVAGLSQQMRQAMAAEGSTATAATAALRGDLMSQVSQLKNELTGEMSQQLRSMSSEMSDLRRAVTGLTDGMVALQGLVRSMMLGRGGAPGGSPEASVSLMRSAPPVLHASAPDAGVFHSAPISTLPARSLDGSPSGSSTMVVGDGSHFTLTGAMDSGKLPPISGQANGGSPSAPYPPTTRRSSYSPSHQGMGPAATPNVGGFQGARLAAVQKGGPMVGRAGPHVTRHH